MTSQLTITNHARLRSAQRGITSGQMLLAIRYGKLIHRQGMRFYFLRGKDMPPWVDPHSLGRMKNLMVVTPSDSPDVVITVYRNVKGLKRVKRKPVHLL